MTWLEDVLEVFTVRSGSKSDSLTRFFRFLRALPFNVNGFIPLLGFGAGGAEVGVPELSGGSGGSSMGGGTLLG